MPTTDPRDVSISAAYAATNSHTLKSFNADNAHSCFYGFIY